MSSSAKLRKVTKHPVFLVSTAWGPLYANFGRDRFSKIRDRFLEGLDENQYAISLINPIFGQSSIESRAATIAQMIKKKLPSSTEQIHLIGFGPAGIDLRYLAHQDDELRSMIRTVLSVNSPHQGSTVVGLANKGYSVPTLDQVANSFGVDSNALKEFNPSNMSNFNDHLEDGEVERDNVFSISSLQLQSVVNPLLGTTAKFIERHCVTPLDDSANDGLFLEKECHHNLSGDSRHLLTYSSDLIDMLGIGNKPPENLHPFLQDFVINREK